MCLYINMIVKTLVDSVVLSRYIKFPTTLQDFERKREGFAQKTNLFGVFAIVDGTQIHLAGLDHEIESNYVNRRGITAINTQVTCLVVSIFRHVKIFFQQLGSWRR